MQYLSPQASWFTPTSAIDANGRLLSALQREVDHMFDQVSGLPSTAVSRSAAPRISVIETDGLVEIEAELPGVEDKDLEIALNDDVLSIKGEKRMEHSEYRNDYCHQERSFGKFARSITLPFEPDPKTVKTLFAKGVLRITLPKSAVVKQQTVKIPVRMPV